MPKQLGKGIDKEAMFKKIMPSASKPQNAAAAFDPDADGFSASTPRQNSADALDLDGDFGSLDMLDSLGSFDALDSFDLFDEPAASPKAASKKPASSKSAKAPTAKSAAKPPAKSAGKSAGKRAPTPSAPTIEASETQTTAGSARGRSQMPFPINTTAPIAAPAAPTTSIMPDELDLPFTAQPEYTLPAHDGPPLPFPINTSAPIAAPAAPTAPVPPPIADEFATMNAEGVQPDVPFDPSDAFTDLPQNYAIPGGTIPPRTPAPAQPQPMQPGIPAQQPTAFNQPLISQEFMVNAQQQLMQQMQQMQQQMQQQLEQQMRQQLEQQKMLQRQMEQQLAASLASATSPAPTASAPSPDASLTPPPDVVPPEQPLLTAEPNQSTAPMDFDAAAEETSAATSLIEARNDPPQIDPLALIPVNLSSVLLDPRLEEMIEHLHACKCEQCKSDAAAITLNQLPVRYTLSGQITEEDLFNRASVSQVVSALCHAVLFVKSHPRH